MPRDRLTAKQRAFVEEYLVDLNAKAAAIRAGYSERTAHSIGHENLGKPHIKAAIDQAMAARSARTRIQQDEVLYELAAIAFANTRDYVEWGSRGVKLKASETLSVEKASAVAEVSETNNEWGGSLRFKLHPKVTALKLLGQHLGLFKERLEVEVKGGVMLVPAGVSPEEWKAAAAKQQAELGRGGGDGDDHVDRAA